MKRVCREEDWESEGEEFDFEDTDNNTSDNSD